MALDADLNAGIPKHRFRELLEPASSPFILDEDGFPEGLSGPRLWYGYSGDLLPLESDRDVAADLIRKINLRVLQLQAENPSPTKAIWKAVAWLFEPEYPLREGYLSTRQLMKEFLPDDTESQSAFARALKYAEAHGYLEMPTDDERYADIQAVKVTDAGKEFVARSMTTFRQN